MAAGGPKMERDDESKWTPFGSRLRCCCWGSKIRKNSSSLSAAFFSILLKEKNLFPFFFYFFTCCTRQVGGQRHPFPPAGPFQPEKNENKRKFEYLNEPNAVHVDTCRQEFLATQSVCLLFFFGFRAQFDFFFSLKFYSCS